jgi:hypothetical protein
MLDRQQGLLALFIAVVFLPSSVLAATPAAKLAAAKRADLGGYSPAFAKAALLTETEPNDSPAEANAISVGDIMDASFQLSGDADWFRVTSNFSGYLRVSTASSGGSATDTFTEVFDASASVQITFDDDSGLGLFSSTDHIVVEVGTEILVRVSHFAGLSGDNYQLVVEVGTPPPPVPENNGLAMAEFVDCNKAIIGTTIGASDDLPSGPCLTIETAGGEVYYRVVLPYSHQLNVQANPIANGFDPALTLFTDSRDPQGSCLAAADDAFDGEAEGVVYTNEDFEGGLEVFVSVDSWSPASAGDFVLDIRCDFVVATETTNWSTLKASW